MADLPAPTSRRIPFALLTLGVGLALAPAIFGMFGRAPAGGQMIDDFRPYMTEARLGAFRDHLGLVNRSQSELIQVGAPTATPAPQAAALTTAWPRIEEDMTSMIDTIEGNLTRFAGLTALPPFWAFPWFFVIPGLMLAAASVALLYRPGPRTTTRLRRGLVGLGIGLVAAPFAFQMFSRAPGGAAMIDDFRPLMTPDRIASVQGHFLTIAGGEAQIRNQLLPELEAAGMAAPATAEFVSRWPAMAADMAPMIGAMADNLDNFAGVDALPPFWAFPWFFVAPGIVAAALALCLSRPAAGPAPAPVPSLERSTA